ncbi:Peptidyl-prolyl cis-trans isomerase FKBP20-2-chloroplastic [Striga hermonthica]|uniref:Rotamase n=1 Tax=Striga hermonthica TaxID=68872 RepID=A0A9N7NHB5_STRHE|nr:Peptidyl-prolyl cis-trans isomerase FKBP20-2-chloroplastic [Striga hermonthica]
MFSFPPQIFVFHVLFSPKFSTFPFALHSLLRSKYSTSPAIRCSVRVHCSVLLSNFPLASFSLLRACCSVRLENQSTIGAKDSTSSPDYRSTPASRVHWTKIPHQSLFFLLHGRNPFNPFPGSSPIPARIGCKKMFTGFEEGLRDMKPRGKRRLIIPPELGSPGEYFSS